MKGTDLRMPEKRFRPEIEGVRVFAALLVAIYHIWFGTVSGGVDVFFIVSGYLITLSLLNRIENYGKINYFEYVLGLLRRLVPLAFTVIIAIILLSFFLMPQFQWNQVIGEIFASVFYYENWQLAFNSVDYLAQNNEASPLQHFWALSIQGQFYVTWPFIIFITYMIARKLFKTPIRKTLLSILLIIFVLSLSYSIFITGKNQPWAYFDTFARVWEFSLGGILALLLPYLRFNKHISFIVGWLGLLIICFTGMILPVSDVFPGFAALLPTTGVMLVIISAENSSKYAVERFLSMRAFQYSGGISYGFYLWHWPLLIFYYYIFQTDKVPFLHGLLILLITAILSIISTRLIETPVRKLSVRNSKKKLVIIVAAFFLSVLSLNFSWQLYYQSAGNVFAGKHQTDDYPGALALIEGITANPDVEPIMMEEGEESALPFFYQDKDCYTHWKNESEVKICSFGETENPDFTIALVGGSHSGHWFPALMELTEKLNFQLDLYNKDGCRFTTDEPGGPITDTCYEWNKEVIDYLIENEPEIVFTTANVNVGDHVPQGYIEQWKKLEGVSEVFAIRDNPRMAEKVPLCLETKSIEECSMPRDEVLSEVLPWENTDGIPSNVTFGDLSDAFCDEETCYAVIGNVIVYRDEHHITNLYSKTLAPALEVELKKAIEKIK